MNKINPKITATIFLALITTSIATPQKADAQVLELATGALNAIFNRPPKPIPNQNYTFGTNNLNSNNFNLCLLPCTPGIGSSPIRLPILGSPAPTAVAPAPISPTGIVPTPSLAPTLPTGIVPAPGSVSQSQTTVTNQVGTIAPGGIPTNPVLPTGAVPSAIPSNPVLPNAIPPQIVPTPPRPTVVIPPIKLPINLPL